MRDENDGEDDAGNDIADNHLEQGHVAAVSQAGNADDGQRAGFRCNDGETDAPPGNIFAAEEIIASAVLVFAEPNAEGDDSQEIKRDDDPVARAEVAVHGQSKTGLISGERIRKFQAPTSKLHPPSSKALRRD